MHPVSVHPGDTARLRQSLDLAAAGEWSAAAAGLAAVRSGDPGLPAFPALEAAVFLLAGRRGEAIGQLAAAQRRAPRDSRIAHMLLLACYHTLRDDRARGGLAAGEAAALAERLIASWVVLAHQDRFWADWLDERLGRYGEAQEAAAAGGRDELAAELAARLSDLGAGPGAPGDFAALLQRETAAAGRLAAAGGLPLADGEAAPFICGPLMIRALGCAERLGAFVAELPRRRLAPAARQRLRRSFSRLGVAEALLDLGRPEEARTALGRLACAECAVAADAGSPGGCRPVLCASTCPHFDDENPGYAGEPEKAQALERDALELAIDVQLALGQSRLTAPDGGPDAAAGSFREALRLAAAAGCGPATERRVVEAVLGRVTVLAEKRRLDAAIALLETGLAACSEAWAPAEGTVARERLTGQLAELLAWRGAEAVESRRWEPAVADLRRAAALNPHATDPLLALGHALQGWARQLELRRTSSASAVEAALETVRRFQARLPEWRGRPEAQEQLHQVRESARGLVRRHAGKLATAGGFPQALQALDQGLAELPGDAVLTGCRREVVLRYARFLEDRGQRADAAALLERAGRARPASGKTAGEDMEPR